MTSPRPSIGSAELVERIAPDRSLAEPTYLQLLRKLAAMIEAGETAGILEDILDRLAVYLEKSEALKSKVRSALMYPAAVITVAIIGILAAVAYPAYTEQIARGRRADARA
mgnify:CR=1 FL=1